MYYNNVYMPKIAFTVFFLCLNFHQLTTLIIHYFFLPIIPRQQRFFPFPTRLETSINPQYNQKKVKTASHNHKKTHTRKKTEEISWTKIKTNFCLKFLSFLIPNHIKSVIFLTHIYIHTYTLLSHIDPVIRY